MKVKELIELLKVFDDEQEITISCPDCGDTFPIEGIFCEYEQENVKNVYIEI